MMELKQDNPRITELISMANGLYGTITGLTNSPQEFVTILAMMHLRIWLNCGDGEADTMLKEYCRNFKENLQANEAVEKGKLQ